MLNRYDGAKYVGSYDLKGTKELTTNLQLEECCVETSTKRQYLFPLLTIAVVPRVEELKHKLPKNGPPCIVPFAAIQKGKKGSEFPCIRCLVTQRKRKVHSRQFRTTIDYWRPPCCPPDKKAHVVVLHISFVNTGPARRGKISHGR
jgi:hypothetical protein